MPCFGAYPEFNSPCRRSTKTAAKFPFDVLDATKLIPEELVPLQPVGQWSSIAIRTIFAETEQVAFHPGHGAGIDFTNDPLLQGRLFSYTNTNYCARRCELS
jgi:catalase